MSTKRRNSTKNLNSSLLFDLCAQGDLTTLEKYLSPLSVNEISSIRDEHQATLAHYAARHGHEHILNYLIERKQMKIRELYTVNGATCAHDAAVCDQVEVLDYLLNYDPVDENQGSYSTQKFNWTVRDDKGHTLLHLAAGYGSVNVLHYLLKDHSADVNIEANNGFRPIHCACLARQFESAKVLLSASPKTVNQQSKNLLTPAYLACQSGSIDLVQLLSSYGANFQLRDENGMSCLLTACFYSHIDIIKWLINTKNAVVNEVDYSNNGALHYAALNGDEQVLNYLFDHNAQVTTANDGNTPLHSAAKYGLHEATRILIERGHCSLTARNNSNLTAADLADQSGFPALANELRHQMRLLEKETSEKQNDSDKTIHLTNATIVRLVVKKRNVQKRDVTTQVAEDEILRELSNLDRTDEHTRTHKSTTRGLTNRRFDVTELRARVEAYESVRNNTLHSSANIEDVLMHSVASLNQHKRNRPRSKLPQQTYAPWLKMSNITPQAFHDEIQKVSSNLRKVRRDSLLRADHEQNDENQRISRQSRSMDNVNHRISDDQSSSASSTSNRSAHRDSPETVKKASFKSPSKVNPASKSHQFICTPSGNDGNQQMPSWRQELIERRRASGKVANQ